MQATVTLWIHSDNIRDTGFARPVHFNPRYFPAARVGNLIEVTHGSESSSRSKQETKRGGMLFKYVEEDDLTSTLNSSCQVRILFDIGEREQSY